MPPQAAGLDTLRVSRLQLWAGTNRRRVIGPCATNRGHSLWSCVRVLWSRESVSQGAWITPDLSLRRTDAQGFSRVRARACPHPRSPAPVNPEKTKRLAVSLLIDIA